MSELEEFRKEWISELHQRVQPGSLKSQEADVENPAAAIKSNRYVFHLESNTAFQGNPRAFEIADRLLQGEVLTDDDLYKKPKKRTLPDTHAFPTKLKRSHANVQACSRRSFVDALIDDLNEMTDIPFFDVCLPREVAVKIFKHLDVVDLCRCAQVSRIWRSLAEDELLWHRHCCQMGLANDTSSSLEKCDWKSYLRDQLQKESTLRRNWKNRIGRLYDMEYSQGGVLSAVHSSRDCVVAGYSSGEIRLWRKTSDGVEIHDVDWDVEFPPQKGVNPVSSVALSRSHVIVGYADGTVYRAEVDPASCCSRGRQILSIPGPARVTSSQSTDSFLAFGGTEVVFIDDARVLHQIRLPTKVNNTGLVPSVGGHQREAIISASDDAVRLHSADWFQDDGVAIHHLIGATVTCLDTTDSTVAFGVIDRSAVNVFQVPVYAISGTRLLGTLRSHTSSILCVKIPSNPENLILTGSCDKNARIFDLRTMHCEVRIKAHGLGVSQVQMDEHSLVTGGEDGLVCVWDLRTKAKLWEMFCRHPVRYLRADLTTLVTAHIPQDPLLEPDDGSIVVHARQRGSVRLYDFAADQETKGIPSICLSSYDEPAGYNYNVRLAVPYDSLE